jgi:hypothetical protein
VSKEFYYDRNGLAMWCWRAILGLNVYNFFLRRQALIPCLNNLRDFLSLKPDKNMKDTKKTFEILLIGYFIGIVFMPGASKQFKNWYYMLVPIMFEMIGFPTVLTYFFANEIANRHRKWGGNRLHEVMLGIVAYHLTFGPDFLRDMWSRLMKKEKVKSE